MAFLPFHLRILTTELGGLRTEEQKKLFHEMPMDQRALAVHHMLRAWDAPRAQKRLIGETEETMITGEPRRLTDAEVLSAYHAARVAGALV